MHYRHLNKNDDAKPYITVCFDTLPTVEQLKDSISVLHPHLTVNMGVAVLHPNDRYVKKTGREESAKAVQPTTLSFVSADKRKTSIVFTYKVEYKRPTKNNNYILQKLYLGLQYDSFGTVKVKYVSKSNWFDASETV